jgi:hypothetical protein
MSQFHRKKGGGGKAGNREQGIEKTAVWGSRLLALPEEIWMEVPIY